MSRSQDKIRLGIDASMLVYAGSGVARYTYELIRHVLELSKEEIDLVVFYASLRKPEIVLRQLAEFRQEGATVRVHHLPPRAQEWLWNKQMIFPVEWLTGKVDIWHSSDFLRPPLLPGTVGLTTVHDVTWKLYPEYHTERIVESHERKMARTIALGDKILASSQNTKHDMLQSFPKLDENNVDVCYLGVDEAYFEKQSNATIQKVLKKYGISTSYLLYVGAIEPRKNIVRLLQSFSRLNSPDMKLVIAGRAGWKNELVRATVMELNLENQVVFTGYVEEVDLPLLYSGAVASCYVTLYEGFGLPILESQAAGCPVVTSNVSSIPEIAKGSTVLVDPVSIDDITNGLEKVIRQRKGLINKGIQNAKQYTWGNTARQYIDYVKRLPDG